MAMKIELFEKKGKKRRYLSSRNEDTTYYDICYKISRDGFDDVFVILRENNYCGDFDFYTKFESEDPGMKKRNFKPDLTSKDYENCVKILKSWRDVKDIFLPGANCSTRGHCEFSNINFLNLEIDYNFPELYRFYKVPVEKYLEEEFDDFSDEFNPEEKSSEPRMLESQLVYDFGKSLGLPTDLEFKQMVIPINLEHSILI
jgi:hypothetical protein